MFCKYRHFLISKFFNSYMAKNMAKKQRLFNGTHLYARKSYKHTRTLRETGNSYLSDFCRATQCNFCRTEVASEVSNMVLRYQGDKITASLIYTLANSRRFHGDFLSFGPVSKLMQLWSAKNCIELHNKNRPCKRALREDGLRIIIQDDTSNTNHF